MIKFKYKFKIYAFVLLLLFSFLNSIKAATSKEFITLQSTTSTQNSGFYDYILPIFSDVSNIEVRVVAVGTGQAIKMHKIVMVMF